MTHSDGRANLDLSDYLNLALRLANLFPAVLDFQTGEIAPDLWDEVVGNPPGTTPPRLETWEAAIHPDDRPARDASWAGCLAGRAPLHQAKYRVRRHDGRWVWIMVVGKVVERDEGGRPLRLALAVRNIDDLRQAEQQLRERERELESLMGHLPGLAYRALADDHWTALFASRGIEDLTGYPADEFTSRRLNYADIMLPEDRPATRAAVFTGLRERRMYEAEHRIRHKDGSVRWIWARGHGVFAPDGHLRFIEGLNLDMTRQKQAEERLRESEQRWRSLTEALPQLVWSATPDGACDYFSTQWTQHTGVPESDLLGWRWLAVLHPDDREPTRRFWTDSVAERGPYDVEYRVRRSDGVYRWFKTRGTPIRDSAGRVVTWFGTCTDISDLRETEQALRESEERFRGTFENAAVGIVHNDPAGGFLRVNETYCAIVGYSREELLQKTLWDIIHPDELAAFLELYTSCFSRGESPPFGYERRYLRKDGSTVWVEVFASFQRDSSGRPAYAIAAVQDISGRKRMDEELRQAKDAAEAANRAKDEFLANVSHEIRTPMNAILGMTELVLDTPLDEGQRQGLKTVKSAADSLLGIINDLLEFSKIEAGKLELVSADFSLRAAIGETLRTLAVRAHKKGLELIYQVQPDVPDALVGDAGRLRQVLLNLAGNAVKFTDEGEVVVRVEIQGGDSAPSPGPGEVGLRFTVRDTGIGIPPDQQARIFRAFEQEDTSTTRKYGGTGLGLTIASQLVALMGGTITVDSAPGRGSTFAFTARFARQLHPSGPVPAQPPVSLDNLPVLVVDDNATNRHILAEWLRGWQLDPTAVGDGMAAMDALWHRAANGRPYALVLLDARMPDTDGLAVIAMIRERAELAATHIILLTSGERPGDRARIRELRIDAQLLKPVQQDELLETIYRVMSRSQGKAPLSAWSASRQQASTAPVPAATPLHILVAEDNELSAQVLEQSLVREEHRVRLASNGREALTLAEQGGFDLLLLDVHMPELDGFQVVQAVRARELTAGGHLPIIALTARSRKEDRERCLAAGMDEFLTKPIRPADLSAAIDRVLRIRPSRETRGLDSLDAPVLLAACGGDPTLLRKMCQTLTARVPEHLAALREALRDQDAPRLREAAHRCCGMLSEFSTAAGDLAGCLEDLAAGSHLDEAAPILQQLETTAQELVKQIDGTTVGALRRKADRVDQNHEPAGR